MIWLTEAAGEFRKNEVLSTPIEEILVVAKTFSNTDLTEDNFCGKGRADSSSLHPQTKHVYYSQD